MTREWVLYTASGGGKRFEKAVEKAGLTRHEYGQLAEVMDRIAEDRVLPREVKDLGGGVLQFQFDVPQRSYRLLYAKLDDELVLLALHFFRKTKNIDRNAVDLARERLRDWNQR